MCSRYTPTGSTDEISNHYKVKLGTEQNQWRPTTFPGYDAPVVIGEGEQRRIDLRFWGFVVNIPSKRDPSKLLEKVMQNAVSETIEHKRTFSGAWNKSQRCVIPASNFLEPKNRIFVPIKDSSQPILSIAGIYGESMFKGTKKISFTMLTCEPNDFMVPFHDRMPVILIGDDVEAWLSADTTPDDAKKMCRPYRGLLRFAE